MQLLYWLEGLRRPWLDQVMLIITQFGGEIIFMALAIALFWCIDKHKGYFMLTVGFVGTIVNQFLKIAFRISRPWVQDPEFTIVEAARADATGYSFPSGHTQNAATTLGCSARMVKSRAAKIALWVLYALVALSRMYLGVHTPLDVGVSLVLGLVLVFALYPLFNHLDAHPNRMYALLGGMLALSVAYLLYTELRVFPADVEVENLLHARENAYKLTGAVAGMLLAYWVDARYIHFAVKASWPAQIVKCVAGLALTMAVRSLLKAPLNALFDGACAAHGVRYFATVVFAAMLWPMTFPWIRKILPGKKA